MNKKETIKALKENMYLERVLAKRPGISKAEVVRAEKAIEAYSAAIRLLED